MTTFVQLQAMAEKQEKILQIFRKIKVDILTLAQELEISEHKTSGFLTDFADGGWNAAMQHYMLESRSNIRKASEDIKLDDILQSVNKESVSREAAIVPLKKAPDVEA